MASHHETYEGFDLSWEEPPAMTGGWHVSIASNDIGLLSLLERGTHSKGAHIITGRDKADALKMARDFIDRLIRN